MPGPPSAGQKFVVCIEIDGPISQAELDKIKKDLKQCAEKAGAHIAENRIEGPRNKKGRK